METNFNSEQEKPMQQNIYVNVENKGKSNGIGTAGFVLALLAIVFCWVPGFLARYSRSLAYSRLREDYRLQAL